MSGVDILRLKAEYAGRRGLVRSSHGDLLLVVVVWLSVIVRMRGRRGKPEVGCAAAYQDFAFVALRGTAVTHTAGGAMDAR